MSEGYLMKALLQIKDSALFLGCLYFLVFIMLLPEFAIRQGVVDGFSLMFAGALSVLAVHFFLNWLYIAVVAIPFTMAALLFIAGCSIWLFTPIVLFATESLMRVAVLFVGGSISLTLLNDFYTRLGQFLMIVSGGIWWVVTKAKDLNQKAITAYIFMVVLFGTIIGITSFARLAGVLFIWLVVYSKTKGENIPDFKALFQVASTVAVLFGVVA